MAAANGAPIPIKSDWPKIAGKVKKTLKSAATTCDAGNNVLLTKYCGFFFNVNSGQVSEMDRCGNNYVMEAWIMTNNQSNTTPASDFHRQGAQR